MKLADRGITTLLFDVLGTVVDDAGSFAQDCRQVGAEAGLAPTVVQQLLTSWLEVYERIFGSVRHSTGLWRSQDSLLAEALAEAMRALEVFLPEASVKRLSLIAHRFRPWPDAVEALQRLAPHVLLVALSNGNMSLLTDVSRAGGLPWHCVLSGQMVRAYKPDPAVYAMAIDLLDLDPERSMMVAAHPWDLRAAAAHGLRTAYIARAGEGSLAADDRFDVYAEDLADLASNLIGAGT